ncbi:hypothetical protein RRG08_022775 [Elysia crispata]|uniref:Neurotransmitter-gated ion-channel transmembrane domain-containing protein n=1 Tax=Elysia crispata TaxID=231223 RepID=A0AAE1A2Y7_9GAST|nr:hypothetical protein RRG08_022775 [Elysia crispata]
MRPTVLLAYAVYLTIVSDHLPNTSVQTSILAVYLTALLGITAVSTVLSVFILKLHHRSPTDKVGKRISRRSYHSSLKKITFSLSKEDEHFFKNTVTPSFSEADSLVLGEGRNKRLTITSSPPYQAAPERHKEQTKLRVREGDVTQDKQDSNHLDVRGRRRSRAATPSHVVMDRRLSSPPVYHAPMTWQDVAQTIDWFLFLFFTIFSGAADSNHRGHPDHRCRQQCTQSYPTTIGLIGYVDISPDSHAPSLTQ